MPAEEPLPVDAEVPFNLKTLRRHLSRVVLMRHVLSEDTMLRERLLEQSVLNVAAKQMKRHTEVISRLSQTETKIAFEQPVGVDVGTASETGAVNCRKAGEHHC